MLLDLTTGSVSTLVGTPAPAGPASGAQDGAAAQATFKTEQQDVTTVNTTSKHIGLIQHLALVDDDTAVYPVFHKLFSLKLSTGVESDLTVLTAAGHQDGALTTLFHYPQGLGVHGSGASAAIYLADRQNAVLRRIADTTVTTPAGIVGQTTPKALDGIATQSTFNWPLDVAVALTGDVYIADAYNNRVRRYRP